LDVGLEGLTLGVKRNEGSAGSFAKKKGEYPQKQSPIKKRAADKFMNIKR